MNDMKKDMLRNLRLAQIVMRFTAGIDSESTFAADAMNAVSEARQLLEKKGPLDVEVANKYASALKDAEWVLYRAGLDWSHSWKDETEMCRHENLPLKEVEHCRDCGIFRPEPHRYQGGQY